MNNRLKKLMKDLGDAINGSLSESEQIAVVISKIKDEGFDIFLVLEATIGFNSREDEAAKAGPELVGAGAGTRSASSRLQPMTCDFLKSLRISVEDAARATRPVTLRAALHFSFFC